MVNAHFSQDYLSLSPITYCLPFFLTYPPTHPPTHTPTPTHPPTHTPTPTLPHPPTHPHTHHTHTYTQDLINNYTCTCPPLFTGANCDVSITIGQPSPGTLAVNGGVIGGAVVGVIAVVLILIIVVLVVVILFLKNQRKPPVSTSGKKPLQPVKGAMVLPLSRSLPLI